MGLGAEPQQLLLRPGILVTLAPGVRAGGGYAWIATAPYGEAPSRTPLREHRAWQQLTLAHRSGGVDVSHRFRTEQRWIALVEAEGTTASGYQQRVRYMARAQRELGALRRRGAPLIGFVWDEIFLSVGHGDATVRATQNRLGGGIGIPVDSRQRIEIGYMNLWNPLTAARVNENNHTLTVSLVRSARR